MADGHLIALNLEVVESLGIAQVPPLGVIHCRAVFVWCHHCMCPAVTLLLGVSLLGVLALWLYAPRVVLGGLLVMKEDGRHYFWRYLTPGESISVRMGGDRKFTSNLGSTSIL